MNLYFDINAKADPGGRTAFEIAVLTGREDLVELFIKYAGPCYSSFNLSDHPGLCVLLLKPISESMRGYFESGALEYSTEHIKQFGIDANDIVQFGQLTHLQLQLK